MKKKIPGRFDNGQYEDCEDHAESDEEELMKHLPPKDKVL